MPREKLASTEQNVDDNDNILWTSLLGSIVSLLVTVFISLQKRSSGNSSSCPLNCTNTLQNTIDQLSQLNKKFCPCDKNKKEPHINGNMSQDFEVISASELADLDEHNAGGILSTTDEAQTNITNDRGEFKFIEGFSDFDNNGALYVTTTGLEKETQIDLIEMHIEDAIICDGFNEADLADIMDQEIQNKPSTSCACVQYSNFNCLENQYNKAVCGQSSSMTSAEKYLTFNGNILETFITFQLK